MFSDKQKEEIINDAWKKPNDHVKEFIDSAEYFIREWVEYNYIDKPITDKEVANQVRVIRELCKKLLSALKATNKEVLHQMEFEYSMHMMSENEKNNGVLGLVKALNVKTNGRAAAEYGAEVIEILDKASKLHDSSSTKLCKVLNESLKVAQEMSDNVISSIEIRTGPKEKNKVELVRVLGLLYLWKIKKKPSASKTGNFYLFVKKIGEILNISFGDSVIKEGISML